jgi:hypothetical protein
MPTAGEKLILGFEKAELESKKEGRTCWTILEDAGGGVDFYHPFEFAELDRVWTWHCRSGQATEGRLALAAKVGPNAKSSPEFVSTPVIDRCYPVVRGGRTSVVLNTFGFLARSGSELGNWSGYDLFRLDLRAEANVHLWVAVEDDLIEPPVVCEYDVPAGRWVTLEVDLRKAVQERDLDLKKIANFWVLGRCAQATEVRVDNVRLATAGAALGLEVLRDDRPLTLPKTPTPERPILPKLDAKPDRSPVQLAPPRVVERATVAPFGWIAAYDNQRLLLGHCLNDKPTVSMTADGGATWKDLASPVIENLDHGTARGSVVDQCGDVLIVSSGPGCAGVGVVSPRQFLSKYTFAGATWEYRRPPAILDCDIRHCCSNASSVRLREGPHAGRLWAVWGQIDRFRSLCVHARFSDDDGLTWQQAGKGAMVPGSRESYYSFNTYSYQQPRCTPYGDGIAVSWQDARGLMWNRFDGRKWAEAEVIEAGAAPMLAPTEGESFRVPGSCVTRGGKEVFVTAWKVPGVLRWDGARWRRELFEASDAGVLTLCGGKDLMLFTAGSTEQPPPRKRVRITKQASVLCYRRTADGAWKKPLDLSGGPTTILEYRQITALVAPPYAPPNFAPVAWSDLRSVKVVKVPVLPANRHAFGRQTGPQTATVD